MEAWDLEAFGAAGGGRMEELGDIFRRLWPLGALIVIEDGGGEQGGRIRGRHRRYFGWEALRRGCFEQGKVLSRRGGEGDAEVKDFVFVCFRGELILQEDNVIALFCWESGDAGLQGREVFRSIDEPEVVLQYGR